MTSLSATPVSFSSSRQLSLYERLNHFISPGSAAMYRDAHRLLAETTPYASTTHLVVHLFREIESAVRYVLLPYDYAPNGEQHTSVASPPPSETTDQTDPVEQQPVQEGPSTLPPSPVASSRTASDEIQQEQGENHKQEIEAIVARYHLPPSLTKTWAAVVLRSKTGAGFAEYAHRDALAMPRPRDAAFDQAIQQFEALLEQVMEAFERRSFHIFNLLDHLLAKTQPGRRDANLFLNRVPPNRVTYAYFFSRLENPVWLTLLAGKRVFAPPPMGLEEGRVYYDLWPQADYLKRMAANPSAQAQVLSLLLAASRSENPFVQRAIVEIGTLLPAPLAAHIAPMIKRWFDQPDPHTSFVIPFFAPFLEQLVQGGEGPAALDLLDAILTRMGERDAYTERWEYEQLLMRSQSLLVATDPHVFLHALCSLLEREVYQHFVRYRTLEETDTTVQTRAQEASTLWQPTIEASGQSSPPGTNAPLHLLVVAIRQTAEQAITAQTLTLSQVVSLLGTHPGNIFRRLALYILSRFAPRDPALVRIWLLNRSLFNNPDLRPEYLLLVRAGLPMLSPEEQETLLQWIKEGPDPALLQWTWYNAQGIQETPTEELIQLRKAQWQWRRLEEVGEALPPTWQRYCDELAEIVGSQQASASEEEGRLQNWPGALSVESYKAMPLDQFLAALEVSAAEPGSRTASLLSVLSTLISDAPAQFAERADLFQEQSPELVTAALRGFTQAIIRRHPFDWSRLLPLCAWTLEQRLPSIEEEEASPQINPAWDEASKEVAVLLETTFRLSKASLSPAWQQALWSMLAMLVNDTYGLAQQLPGREPPPAWSLALNSTRGQALLASIEYARWVWEDWQSDHTPQDAEEERWALEQVPEVLLLLERFLVQEQDDTGVAHAVLGYMFPLLFHLDEQWTTQHQQAIFPHDEASRPSFDAAWEAFLLHAPPSRKVLEALRGEYSLAISRLQSNDDRQLFHEEPVARLALHLAVFVIRGDIATQPADPLLVQFFQRASDELRHRLVSEIGRILVNEREHLPDQAVEHCQHFWEWRMMQVGALPDAQPSAHELAAFGWWVYEDIFPAHWSVEQLARVLDRSKQLDMSSFVVHRLASLVSQEPAITLQCLSHLVEGDTNSWGNVQWNEDVRTILLETLQQQDEAIRAQARAVTSVLMMQGHTQYRELLSHSESER